MPLAALLRRSGGVAGGATTDLGASHLPVFMVAFWAHSADAFDGDAALTDRTTTRPTERSQRLAYYSKFE